MNSIRRRSVVKTLIHYFAFCLQILALIGLTAGPAYAGAGTVKDEQPFFRQPVQRSAAVDLNSNPLPSDSAAGTSLALAQASVLDEGDPKPEEKDETIEPVTRKLPIWGEQARQKGFDLPLPFGMGANYAYIDQGINIRNLKVGIGDPTIEVRGLEFKDARSHDSAITARLDMWLLPFVNLYGLFGSINGEAEFDLDISQITGGLPPVGLPPIFEPNQTIDLNIDYNGYTFGGGVTLAGGYANFFGSLDANYTYSKVDVVDGRIDTVTVSPRLGLLVDPPEIKGSLALWIGAMYMYYKQTVTDDINLREVDPRLPPVELAFKLDVKNEQPWNFLLGGQWEITKRLQITVEGGVGERKQVITGISYRF
ncbi:MAG: hypothetical protein JSW26_11485 [Desulfobacterales bacterium]|nr:MAG: hypothetical protein JSW26_11485 [Desulfobacterales bacterium]